MAQAKWLKVGAAAFLSIGMLAACGDAEDEAPVDNDADVTPEEGEEEVIPEGDITDTDSEFHDDDSDDKEKDDSGG
ncbi:DNA primase [Planococcus chinensis]|uniref:DNA primase n=1 Tax=Planococcus chinensis TaxID=272917 RepID=A0ABW4QCN9_9BACL